MKLHFTYDIEKDIENFINGTRAVNSKKPTKFQTSFSEKYGDNFEAGKVKEFIEEQDKISGFDAKKEIVAVEERWKITEPIFVERVEKIFGISYPTPIITVYLTHNERCTYNIEQNYFFVRIGSEFSSNTLMHELLHFYTWHAFGKKLLDEGLSKLAYNDIKESLTELLNLEFSDLLNGKSDSGYPQHQEMRDEVKKLWLEKKDVKAVADNILGNEKFKKRNWQEYYEITKNKPPTKLLIKALEYVPNKNKVIDIGGGALKDTRYLLEQGFDVTVVDKADLMAKEAEAIKSDKLHYFVSSFADFDFPKNEYDIASAMYSLPFNPPESFDIVFEKIKLSLVKEGVFCGQCFGVRDEWSTNQKMTFHTKEQVEKLLSDMEVILLDEEEKDDKTANGTPKHWHIFHFIAKKTMIYLYHSVPKNLQGNILYPLNALKEKHPQIYEQQVSKYVGREHITQQRITKLDCLWNDVLHFSAVNPEEVKQALIEAGRNPDFTMSYYQVDPKLIEPKNAIVYLYAHADNKDKMNEENFAPYNPDEVAKFSSMPQATKDYYKEIIGKGERPLLYHRIPHILYKGTLDITDLPIISV